MADSPKDTGNGRALHSPGRRRLLQAGASAAPIVMTVASRPVLAAVQCDSPSGFTSLNVSHPGPGTCLGRSPISWTDKKDNWPVAYTSDPRFQTLFGPSGSFGTAIAANKKLSDVMKHSSDAPWDLAKHIIAAFFNAATPALGTATLLSQATVKHMWIEYSTNGTYSPRAGATWNYNEIIAYLKTTMPDTSPPP
jgi:hypothetical protein